jgi:hypothetical protein
MEKNEIEKSQFNSGRQKPKPVMARRVRATQVGVK